jgi:hypothetical protein
MLSSSWTLRMPTRSRGYARNFAIIHAISTHQSNVLKHTSKVAFHKGDMCHSIVGPPEHALAAAKDVADHMRELSNIYSPTPLPHNST